jgi:uracil phosphoribosyltransferase
MKQTILTLLRDKTTGTAAFRQAADRIAHLLAAEASSMLATAPHDIETPLAKMRGYQLKDEIVLVPILRAGLALLNPFMHLFPDCKVGFVGVKRDEETARPHQYYQNLPKYTDKQFYIILDPMIATGGSGSATVEILKKHGVPEEKLIYVGVVGAPEGMNALKKTAPAMRVICGEIDPELNSKKYIVPGLGDFGDRYFGTEA